MDDSNALIATIGDRCRGVIQLRSLYEAQHEAMLQLDAELGGIRQRGFDGG
jgi:hypothetical protein